MKSEFYSVRDKADVKYTFFREGKATNSSVYSAGYSRSLAINNLYGA